MNVVIVEDSELILKWLTRLVSSVPGVHIAGSAPSEQAAITLIEREQPDLVLLDLALSPGHGFNVLKALRASGNRCKVLVLTNQDIAPLRQQAEQLGADGLHDKTAEIEHVLERITDWSQGDLSTTPL